MYRAWIVKSSKPLYNIFEADKPEIISGKMRRIRAAGLDIGENVHMIGADLATADIGALLEKNGFDKSKKRFSPVSDFCIIFPTARCARCFQRYRLLRQSFGKVSARFRQS